MPLPTKSQKQNKKRKQRRQQTAADRFQKAWERVQNQQKANERLKSQVAEFALFVEQQIGKDEQSYCKALEQQSERLIGFLSKKSLAHYQRDDLMCWIDENLTRIATNPFHQADEFHELTNYLDAHLNKHRDNEFEKQRKKYPELEALQSSEDGSVDWEQFNELFGDDFEDEGAIDDETLDDFFEQYEQESMGYESAAKQQDHSLNKLLKSTNINQLFRRLAKALHPDLVQSDSEKESRHQHMIRLVQARKDKDIVTIMSMYREHIGEMPDGLLESDYEQLTKLLQHRFEQLKQKQQEILMETPREAAIYDRFYHTSTSKVRKELNSHRQFVHQEIRMIEKSSAELTSLKNLKAVLKKQAFDFDDFDMLNAIMEEELFQ